MEPTIARRIPHVMVRLTFDILHFRVYFSYKKTRKQKLNLPPEDTDLREGFNNEIGQRTVMPSEGTPMVGATFRDIFIDIAMWQKERDGRHETSRVHDFALLNLGLMYEEYEEPLSSKHFLDTDSDKVVILKFKSFFCLTRLQLILASDSRVVS